jgi:hypothetical protein
VIGETLAGTWKGPVSGIHFEEKDGVMTRKHVIDVEQASID